MISNKKLNPIIIELFVRGRKLNILIVFIAQTYLKAPKDVTQFYKFFYHENFK